MVTGSDISRSRDWLELLCGGLERLGVEVAACQASGGEATIVVPGAARDDLVINLSRDPDAPNFALVEGIALRFRGTAEPGSAGQRALAVLPRLLRGISHRIPEPIDSPCVRGVETMLPHRALAFAFPFCTAERIIGPDGSAGVGEVLVRLTARCNQACPFCSAPPPRPDPSPDKVEALLGMIDRLAPAATVTFTGGEPTLRRDLARLIERALGAGTARRPVEVQTNAVKLSDPSEVEAFPRSTRLRFFVSLHSMDPATYDRCTGTRGLLPRAVTGIRNLQAQGHEVVLSCVIGAWTAPGLIRFVEDVAAELGGPPRPALHFSITLCPEHRPAAAECLVRYSELAPALVTAHRRARELGLRPEPLLSSSHAAIPACFIDRPDGERPASRPLLEPVAAEAPGEVEEWSKGPRCEGCRSSSSCRGVPRAYADRFGLAELAPPAR
jgi:uncharacterized Fe-S cluster-containing radical SAM superfamily protein